MRYTTRMEPGGPPHELPEVKVSRKPRSSWWLMGIIVVLAILFGVGIWWATDLMVQQSVQQDDETSIPTKSGTAPTLTTESVLSGRDHIWEIAFLPSGQMLFTERKGTLNVLEGGKTRTVTTVDDIKAIGETGLMGLAVDKDYATNRYVYVCYASTRGPDIRVARWKLKADVSGVEDRKDILTSVTVNPGGRHSGCRVAFGPDGYLWVGTGDAAIPGRSPQTPQSLASLNGKLVRIDREGMAAPGNLGTDGADPRIYNYGHRNIQGLAFYPAPRDGVLGVSVEHGSSVDDEINPLVKGNFGWDPDKAYTEANIPMTDKTKFPDAIEAIWGSGKTTQAPSGATFLKGAQWKAWEGSLAVAFLKDQKLKIVDISGANKLLGEQDVLVKQFGRLRAATLGPDGNLYLSTDNGNNADQIIRVTPH
jgi:aldose sugar dehydrogenase